MVKSLVPSLRGNQVLYVVTKIGLEEPFYKRILLDQKGPVTAPLVSTVYKPMIKPHKKKNKNKNRTL